MTFNNYKDALELEPIINNKNIVIYKYILDKLNLFDDFYLPKHHLIDQILFARDHGNEKCLKRFKDKTSFLKQNNIQEIKHIFQQEYGRLILPQGNVFYFTTFSNNLFLNLLYP